MELMNVEIEGENDVRRFLEDGNDVNSRDTMGNTLLHWAAERGEVEIVKLLIDAGADVNARNRHGDSVFFMAGEKSHGGVKHDYSDMDIPVRNLLVEAGADLTAWDKNLYSSNCSARDYEEIVKNGGDFYWRRTGDKSPFIYAIENNFSALRPMIEAGLDINRLDANPISVLLRQEDMDKEDVKEVMRLLLDAGVKTRERVLFTTSSEMLPIAKEFLSYDIDTRYGDGKTAFECALEMKEYSKAAWLLNEGCSIEHCSETLNGEHSDNLVLEAVREQYPNALRQIVASGVDINATDMYGQTELHRLCSEEVNPDGRLWYNQKDGGVSVRMLIEVGADVNARDESDKTPLHHSIGSMASNVIDVLIKNGADPRIADKDGDTPVEFAQATGDRYLVDRLEAKVMELNLLDKHGVSKDAPRPARGREMTL